MTTTEPPPAAAPYRLDHQDGEVTVHIQARGRDVLASPTINRGTAFTYEQRIQLGLLGLLPTGISTLDSQVQRVWAQYRQQPTDLAKWVYLANLRDRNEVLFHRLLSDHLSVMLPVVYTPTVGTAIERFSHEFRRSRGVFLSVNHPEQVETALRNTGLGPDDIDLLVATDSEGILGIGDQGIGGIEIAIGKLSVYTAAGGIHPRRALPVVLDMGTDNLQLLNDELYLGERHTRVRDHRYDELIDAYVAACRKLFPHAMLHWEDFGVTNARRILNKYADQICTFNDDMQGTAAVVLTAILAALRTSGQQLRDQRIAIYGAGTAGLGIADLLRDQMIREGLPAHQAQRRFFPVGRRGLLIDDDPHLHDFQLPYARSRDELQSWSVDTAELDLETVVAHAKPTILIGTSTHPGAFTEKIVKEMAAHTERPIILPLSNPTSKAEALPRDLITWTEGRVMTATGSPFDPVHYKGTSHEIAQANNALIFPGLGLGVAVCHASRISDAMIAAAANAVADMWDASAPGVGLLPPMTMLRTVSAAVGVAVATTAAEEGLAGRTLVNPAQQVHDAMWRPEYPRIEVSNL